MIVTSCIGMPGSTAPWSNRAWAKAWVFPGIARVFLVSTGRVIRSSGAAFRIDTQPSKRNDIKLNVREKRENFKKERAIWVSSNSVIKSLGLTAEFLIV